MSALCLPPELVQSANSGQLSHAYILAGPDPEGRERAGRALAAAYLCAAPEGRPCGECKGCHKVEKDVHPDVIWVSPEPGKDLTVDQVRDLRSDVYIRPNEASAKVYLLKDAQRMNANAQNAFLKVLEDGPAYAAFLLLADNAQALLPTIRSRCETVRLNAPAPADPDLERRAGELAGLLLSGDRWGMVNWCVPYERGGREEVLALWKATRKALLTYRDRNTTARAVRLASTLEEITAAAAQNANLGALWGWLWAAVQ